MRYIINDDDFESWIEILESVNTSLDVQSYDLEYVISAMKNELSQHISKKD